MKLLILLKLILNYIRKRTFLFQYSVSNAVSVIIIKRHVLLQNCRHIVSQAVEQ